MGFEIVKTYRLVALGCYMQNIEAILISGVHICSVFHKGLHYLEVAFKGAVVEGGKFIFCCFQINPKSHLILIQISLGLVKKSLYDACSIFKCSSMQQTIAVLVNDLVYFKFTEFFLEVVHEFLDLVSLNKPKAVIGNRIYPFLLLPSHLAFLHGLVSNTSLSIHIFIQSRQKLLLSISFNDNRASGH